jgi:hypothetical protein
LIYPFNLPLSGLNEVPPNASPATGSIVGTFDDATNMISFTLTFDGLLSPTTNAHFHAPAGLTTNAPVIIGFIPNGFPLSVQSGVFASSYILTAQQKAWLLSDSVYVNVHTQQLPGGELRVQMVMDAPLPVELASFTSAINANSVTLNWTTSTETNNSGFEIERSTANAGNEWAKVGFVSGNGTVSSPVNYTYTDKGLNIGIYNYRLKQIDFNGNYEYFNLSNEVNVGVPSQYNLSQNYPNPFNPTTRIDYQLPFDGNVSLKLFDVSGKEVMQLVNGQRSAGYYSLDINASSLSSGIYFYTISSNDFVSTKKLMLLK